MTMPEMKRSLVLASMLFCAPGIAFGDDDVRVDCGGGDSIQSAIAKKNPGRPLLVMIRGACTENVTITQDDVTLQGDGASITGAVTITGGQRVVVERLRITNPVGEGVTVQNGASATLRNNNIDDSSGYGIFLRNASFATVNGNTLLRNGIVNPTNVDASGIGVSVGSTVRASGNEIRENANTGVEVFDSSLYRSERDTIAQRTSAPGRSAVDTFRGGQVELRGATINGQVFANQHSQLQVRVLETPDGPVGSTITGNIAVSQLSFLRLRAGVVRAASILSCGGGFSVCQCDGFPGSVCPVIVP